ncbi:hypothetical protein SBA7_20015 [Candidatus Sulfotelmatobacter sp. SbA7]|nr:hypothetical protein SBA7_20015 [Candidatus Sulfotelmatobacter sp. SbA7]
MGSPPLGRDDLEAFVRQNCPSITDKGTQTLTFDAQFPHDIAVSVTDCCSFVCSKLHTDWCAWSRAMAKRPVRDSGNTIELFWGLRTLFTAEF